MFIRLNLTTGEVFLYANLEQTYLIGSWPVEDFEVWFRAAFGFVPNYKAKSS